MCLLCVCLRVLAPWRLFRSKSSTPTFQLEQQLCRQLFQTGFPQLTCSKHSVSNELFFSCPPFYSHTCSEWHQPVLACVRAFLALNPLPMLSSTPAVLHTPIMIKLLPPPSHTILFIVIVTLQHEFSSFRRKDGPSKFSGSSGSVSLNGLSLSLSRPVTRQSLLCQDTHPV
ncbi:hypothetical protein M404DRAFT_678750 [Pisolithus tinctorius Marx 270]|uniref:Secreted protein n=1 Tax=Pisolithus tinctorius Marx 270 TaxID=870435 RepID=A0A0C3PF54_PISTI|nr:hypothetical protein M404DRAFT_678750 [Pisolithus tinctorius Marx 270]